jgi:predicted nucleic acid-binding protein
VLIASDVTPIPGELAISVVSLAELQFGILVAKSDEARATRLARLTALQRRFDPLPVDEAVADGYGRLAARVVQVGRRPRARDLLIAATAYAHEASVYTRNPADFAGLEDLVHVVTV